MLDQLIQKRNEQLNEVNEFMQSSQANSMPQLKSLHKSIKQNYAAFTKGLSSVFESILFRTKLANPFKLFEFVKYAQLMSIEERVCLANVRHLLDFYFDTFIHVLTSNRIFLYCSLNVKMAVVNKSGDLIHLKKNSEWMLL